VPLTPVQRAWYRRVLERGEDAAAVLSATQLMNRLTQLQKVVNHPKGIFLQLVRDQAKVQRDVANAEGSEFSLSRLQAQVRYPLSCTLTGL
jgi:hypothetical protein